MSIQSEISRLEEAKTALKNTLNQLGVDVSKDARIDSYYEYVSLIQSNADADTVDGLHFVVTDTESTVDDKTVMTLILRR